MIVNPNWVEITERLFPGQTSYDHLDLVAHVFKMKKQELIEDVYKKNIFERVPAYMYVIKFQKCSLPHLYPLVILEQNS